MDFDNIKKIWTLDVSDIRPAGWFWWFWLFFIKNPKNPAKPKQLMILWSIKKDELVYCNDLAVSFDKNHKVEKNKREFNGTVAAWYFDGSEMHDNYLLENCKFTLDSEKLELVAEGKTSSSFCLNGDTYTVKIAKDGKEMVFNSEEIRNVPLNPKKKIKNVIGSLVNLHTTTMDRFDLHGKIVEDGNETNVEGTSYFQKILMNSPPPSWYWGIFHLPDGSYISYLDTYLGRAILKDNIYKGTLKTPTKSITQDIHFFDAEKQKKYHFKKMKVTPKKVGEDWVHYVIGGDDEYSVEIEVQTYAHACWEFRKQLSFLPLQSTFKYNEYPAILKRLKIKNKLTGEEKNYSNGVGNVEQSWGLLL